VSRPGDLPAHAPISAQGLTAAADKLVGEQYDALRGALLDLAGTY
jgi:hypothetical protein